jgi:hypothetical protein
MRGSALILAGGVLVLAVAGAAKSASKPLALKLLAGNVREILVDRDGVYATFPVQIPSGLRARDISATVVAASLGDRSELRLRNAFDARIQPPVKAQTAVLAVTVRLKPPLKPGTYKLTVAASGGRRGQTRRTARTSLRIVVPAASIGEPKTLVIERTLPLFGHFGKSDEMPPLRVRETSIRSRLTHVNIEQSTAIKDGTKTTGASLLFVKTSTIQPGGMGSATYTLHGGALGHVGTFTGSADIVAPELAAPVSFDFEIHIRRTTWWIVVLAGAGVLLGFFVRKILQRIIDVSRAQEAAGDLALQIENAADDGDKTLKDKLRNASQQLEPAFGWLALSKSPDTIVTATNTAATKYRDAIEDLSTRTSAAVEEQARLGAAIDRDWALPGQADQILTTAQEGLARAKKQIDRNQIDRAKEIQDELQSTLEREVMQITRTWAAEAEQLTNSLETAPVPPATLHEALDKCAQRVQSAAEQASGQQERDVTQALTTLDAVVRSVDGLRRVLFQITEAETHAVQQRVTPAQANQVGDLFNAFADTIGASGSSPGQMSDHYRDFIEGFAKFVRDNGGDATLIEQGRYAEALPVPTPSQTHLGTPSAAPAITPLLTQTLEALAGGWVARTSTPASRVLPALPPARIQLRRAALTLASAWTIQWIVTAVIVVALSYVLFVNDWEGTWQQMAEVFLWAFALDISTNTIVNLAAGGLKRPAATG